MPASVRPDTPWPEIARFARMWTVSVSGAGYVPLTTSEIEEFLSVLAGRLAKALQTDPFSANPGYAIGTDLVAADFSSPEVLGRTLTIVNGHLLTTLGLPTDHYAQRLAQLLETVTIGYARATRNRTLDEQEEVRRAAFSARNRAEEALRSSEAQRRHAALHDPLTGLPNRTMFVERLGDRFMSASSADSRLAVCALNLDRFDIVNDCLGQETGDDIIATVAHRLTRYAADHGYLLARLGGDEFGLLIDETSGAHDAERVAEALLKTIAEPISVDGHQVAITASLGVVEQLCSSTSTTELTRAARMSLRWAKTDGRARWVLFDPARGARQVERSALSAQMPAALERGEFSLLYQPLVNLVNGNAHGMEALARWRHPTQGLIGPERFIDLAEDTGLIVALGTRLLREACQQAAVWHRLSPRAPFVSVNLAIRQLRHPGLMDVVRSALEASALPANRLQLEITEHAVLETDEETIGRLHALAEMGIRLAIDDFGTGYANFAYLRSLPVHELKIDGVFTRSVASTETDPDGEAIVETMVSLGHRLGLTVTSEGVETAGQAERLAALGCDSAQGWHFGRPGSPDHITRQLASQR
ncbi:MAG: bifunctional diguanylate cyclase/phosphodiesterase [Dactylosporangium sp.]|nr:bifunctional diguanylate cyclase/phosphodiesterase [Dactylosporangium sp.]NNJ60439.1 bifunctional diguanylate cyclase/phosphodiesterase [Dactylosporangium sp.]